MYGFEEIIAFFSTFFKIGVQLLHNVVSVSAAQESESAMLPLLGCFSHVQLCVTLTVARQSPLSMEFCMQEYWGGFHALLQGMFPTQGSNAGLLQCRQILYR